MVLIESRSTNPCFNLALEEYVFEHMDRGKSYCMLWQNDKTIVVGKHQNTHAEINAAYVEKNGIQVVRRLSGGGAVYHDMGNLCFTFILDAGDKEKLDFALFCQPVVNALRSFGVAAEITGRNDISIAGQKFSGNSQYIKRGRVMHHGTILWNSDLTVLGKALRPRATKLEAKGVKSVRGRVTNIHSHLAQPLPIEALKEALVQEIGINEPLEKYELTRHDCGCIDDLRRERYDRWDWNWGKSPEYAATKSKRIEGVGQIDVALEAKNGILRQMSITGDFFGSGDLKELYAAVIGRRLVQSDLALALANTNMNHYINNLSADDFIRLILE